MKSLRNNEGWHESSLSYKINNKNKLWTLFYIASQHGYWRKMIQYNIMEVICVITHTGITRSWYIEWWYRQLRVFNKIQWYLTHEYHGMVVKVNGREACDVMHLWYTFCDSMVKYNYHQLAGSFKSNFVKESPMSRFRA